MSSISHNLNDRKVVNGWCMYDWANSVYSLTITSAIFPTYYNNVTQAYGNGDLVDFFGLEVINSVLYSYALSFSFLVVAAILPLLSGIADYGGKKKGFMKFFAYLGSASCAGLFFFTGENIELGIILSVTASIGYSGSLVFYDSYLPEIVTPDKFDMTSARGFSFGYVGSVFLLILNLVMVSSPEWFGITDGGTAARISFLTVGIWWASFSQITFSRLPTNIYQRKPAGGYLTKGYQEVLTVWKSLKSLPDLKKYLLAFFLYNTGVQTVMYLAVLFATKELTDMNDSELILTILIIQLVAIAGSLLFARLSQRRGNKFSLTALVIIWIIICGAAYLVENKYQFFGLAFFVGMVMGGIQALSRATYSKLIPENTIDHASYFSFYDVTYNVSIVVGTFAYGFVEQVTGSMRVSALTLGIFFLAGLVILRRVSIPFSQDSKNQ